jgi:hypothetical protein
MASFDADADADFAGRGSGAPTGAEPALQRASYEKRQLDVNPYPERTRTIIGTEKLVARCHGLVTTRTQHAGMGWHALAPSRQISGLLGTCRNLESSYHADCKSVGLRLQWFESTTCHQHRPRPGAVFRANRQAGATALRSRSANHGVVGGPSGASVPGHARTGLQRGRILATIWIPRGRPIHRYARRARDSRWLPSLASRARGVGPGDAMTAVGRRTIPPVPK